MGIRRWFIRLSVLAGLIYAGTFAFVYGFATTYENPAAPPQADLIVCLGGGAYSDGKLAPSSRGRALTCADLFAQGSAPKILFTGSNAEQSVASVGQAMAELAITKGVDPSAVLIEGESRSTLQNALFSAPQMTDAHSIILVTDGYHLPRSKVSFRMIGPWDSTIWMSKPDLSPSAPPFEVSSIHRETLAIWFNILRFSVWWSAGKLGLQNIDSWLT